MRVSRARASMSPSSFVRSPNGTQPSPSSTARRSERAVRPPTQIGTRGCRARIDDEPCEVVEPTVIFGLGFGQRHAQRAHCVVAACTAIVERRAEQLELLAQRSHTDTDDHASIGHLVERAVTFRDRQRMVVAEHEHMGGEPNRRRVRAQRSEGGERIPIAGAPRRRDVDRDRDVLRAGAMVEAEPVRFANDSHDVGEGARLLPGRMGAGKQGQDRRDDADLQHGSKAGRGRSVGRCEHPLDRGDERRNVGRRVVEAAAFDQVQHRLEQQTEHADRDRRRLRC